MPPSLLHSPPAPGPCSPVCPALGNDVVMVSVLFLDVSSALRSSELLI